MTSPLWTVSVFFNTRARCFSGPRSFPTAPRLPRPLPALPLALLEGRAGIGTGARAGAAGGELDAGNETPGTGAGVDDAVIDVVGDGARTGSGARIEAKDEGEGEGEDVVAAGPAALG